jgi:hypothetical protein
MDPADLTPFEKSGLCFRLLPIHAQGIHAISLTGTPFAPRKLRFATALPRTHLSRTKTEIMSQSHSILKKRLEERDETPWM